MQTAQTQAIVVINNRESLVQGQLQPDPELLKKVKGGGIPINRVVTLLPGANLVDVADIEALGKNEAFARYFTTKIERSLAPENNPEKVGSTILATLEVDGKDGKKVPLQVDKELPLKALKPEVAKLLIDETFVLSTLRGWLASEGRPEVRLLLDNRIRELDVKPEGGPAAAGR
jgi:hypothetical protein